MTIGEKICCLRTAAELSQEELAEKLSVSRQSVSKWEMDQALPQLDKILPLCRLFHISADTLLQPEAQFRLSTDSVACAWFARFAAHSRLVDLGCGSGAIALMLLASDPTLQITGIELQPDAAELAQENARRNQVAFTALHGDLREIRTLLSAGSMDGVISNPPYFPVGTGKQAQGPLGQARSEETLSLSQLAEAAAWLLPTGGRFVLVHRPERLADLIWELRNLRLEPKRIRFVRHKAHLPVSLVLLEAKKGGKPGLSYEPDLVLFSSDGTETPEYRTIYHRNT